MAGAGGEWRHSGGDRPPVLDLAGAYRAVRSLLPPTPLLPVPDLSARLGAPVFLKLESLQVTGSFKARGALAKLLSLSPQERERGVVACSSGNHGLAVAWAASRLEVPATVCVPRWIDASKLSGIRDQGAQVVLAGDTYDQAEREAAVLESARGLVRVHPFDDVVVAAGQGTLALEVLSALPEVETMVVPLSGGGLAGGVGAALAESGREVRLVAVSAERARVMVESLRRGEPTEMAEEETLANALSGGIGLENRVSFSLVRHLVHQHLLVDEEAIRRAMAYAFRRLHLVVEGGGAVGLAALLEGQLTSESRGPVVVVVSGGNVATDVLRRVLEEV